MSRVSPWPVYMYTAHSLDALRLCAISIYFWHWHWHCVCLCFEHTSEPCKTDELIEVQFGTDSCGSRNHVLGTMSPPGDYNWTIRARQRGGLRQITLESGHLLSQFSRPFSSNGSSKHLRTRWDTWFWLAARSRVCGPETWERVRRSETWSRWACRPEQRTAVHDRSLSTPNNTASKRLWFFKKLKRAGVPQSDLVYYYESVMEYASPVWHSSLTFERSKHLK